MNFKSITLICLILFGQTHQAMGKFELSGVGESAKEIVACGVMVCVAVYSCGRAVKDIMSGLFYGSKKKQHEQAERKAKEACEAQVRKEEQERECHGQLEQQQRDAELRWRIARQEVRQKQENEFVVHNTTEELSHNEQTFYKDHIIRVMQGVSHDLSNQYEMYQEIEIEKSEYILKRTEALHDHVNGKDVWKEEKYQVSVQGQQLLREHNISIIEYQTYFGNQIQHTLHQEFVDIIQDTAHIRYKDGVVLEGVKNITTTITQFANVGQLHNHKGYIPQAISYADFCWGALDCIQWFGELELDIAMALGRGAYKGGANYLHKASHPLETVQNTVIGLARLVVHISEEAQAWHEEFHRKNALRAQRDMLDYQSGKMSFWGIMKRGLGEIKSDYTQSVKSVYNATANAWAQLQLDRAAFLKAVENGAEFGTEALLTSATLSALGSLISNASTGLSEIIKAGDDSQKFIKLPFNSSTFEACIAYEASIADAMAAAAQSVKVAGAVAAEVLDDASKLAPGLVLMQNGLGDNISANNNPNPQSFSDKAKPRNWSPDETLIKLNELAVAQQEMQSVGLSYSELIKGYEQFKDVKGFLTKDGPLQKFVDNFRRTDGGAIKTARGAAYEIKSANYVSNGETIIEFGKKVSQGEIDIVTATKWIECKDYYWNKIDKIDDLVSRLCYIRSLARKEGKLFEVYFSNEIPEVVRSKLIKNDISFRIV